MKAEKRIQSEGEPALAFALAGLLGAVALLPVTQLLDLKRAAAMLAGALLASGLAWRGFKRRPWQAPDVELDRLLGILLGVWLLAVLAARLRSGVELRGPLLACGLVLAAGLARAPEAWRARLRAFWPWAVAAVAAYALLQRLGLEPMAAYAQAGSRARAMGSFGNAGYFAAFLCLSWPAFLDWRGRRRWLGLALAAAALLATGSRAGILAVFVQALALLAWSWRGLNAGQRRQAWLALAAAAALVAGLLWHWWRPTLRPQIWALGLRVWLERPLFGWGPGSFALAAEPLIGPALAASLAGSGQYVEDPHQVLVLVLAEGGLLGLTAFAAAAWLALRLARREGGPAGRALALGGLGLLAQSCLDRFFFSAGTLLPLFMLMGLAAAGERSLAAGKAWIGIFFVAALSLMVWAAVPLLAWRQAVKAEHQAWDQSLAAADLEALQARVADRASAADWDRLGAALASKQDYEKAFNAYQRALALEPSAGRAQNAGNCQMMLQRYFAAEAYFRKATDLDPRSADAHFSLGYALFQQRKLARAAASLDAALRLDPEHAGARKLKEQMLP